MHQGSQIRAAAKTLIFGRKHPDLSALINKIRYHSIRIANDVGCAIGLRALLTRNRPGRRLLVYHGIDHDGSTRFNTRFTSAADFEQQLAYFKAHFNVVSLREYFAGVSDPKRLTIAITFDDGYQNNLQLALPLLEKYELPAAFFITGVAETEPPILWPDLLDLTAAFNNEPIGIGAEHFELDAKREYRDKATGTLLKVRCKQAGHSFRSELMQQLGGRCSEDTLRDWELYWKQLALGEIETLAASPLASIGSHGYWHNNLGVIAEADALQELRDSKAFLERVTGQTIDAVAWPDGSYTRSLADKALKLGFTQQLLLDSYFPEDANDPHTEARLGMNPFVSWDNQLIAILRGTYY